MKLVILVICAIFTKYCCFGLDIGAADDDKKKQGFSEEAVDAARSFNDLLMPGPRILYESSTQTASSTGLILESKKQDQDKISDGPASPQLTDQSLLQTTSGTGIIEENKKEGKLAGSLPKSPSIETDENVSQNVSVNSEKKQNNGTAGAIVIDTQKKTPASNLAETIEQKPEIQNKDGEKDEGNKDEELVELIPSNNTPSEIKDTENNTIKADGAGIVIDKGGIVSDNQDNKNDEKQDETVPQISGYVSKNSQPDTKITDDGALSETDGAPGTEEAKKDVIITVGNQSHQGKPIVTSAIEGSDSNENDQRKNKLETPDTTGKQNEMNENFNGNFEKINTENIKGKITDTSAKDTEEDGVEVEKETGNKDAWLGKSEGQTPIDTLDDNSALENENTDNKDSFSSVAAKTKEISDEEENEANNKVDNKGQDSEYRTSTAGNGFSDDRMDSEDENISTSPAETVSESPLDNKYGFDDAAGAADDDDVDDYDDDNKWWEDFEESDDDGDGNDNSGNDLSGDYYDDEEIEDLDDIAEEDDDYDYDDDDYDYDDDEDEEEEEEENSGEGDGENNSDNEVPPKDALIPGPDLGDADSWTDEKDKPSKNVEPDNKYGVDANYNENGGQFKDIETDDKYGSDIKNDENPGNDEDQGGFVHDGDENEENDGDVGTETSTYPTVTKYYYDDYDDDDEDDEDNEYDDDTDDESVDEDGDDDDDMKDTVESGLENGHITKGKRPAHTFPEDDGRYREMTVEFERASSYSWVLFLTIITITVLFVLYINKSRLQRYFTRSAPKAARTGDEEKNLLAYEYA